MNELDALTGLRAGMPARSPPAWPAPLVTAAGPGPVRRRAGAHRGLRARPGGLGGGGPAGRTQAWLYSTRRQIWQSASGLKPGALDIVALPNQKLPWGPQPPAVAGNGGGWVPLSPLGCPGGSPPRGSYAFLATLPANACELRAWIYQHKNGGQQADQQAWTDLGDMFREMLVPPELAAALFKVAATIPGVTVVRHATDAAGRAGIAVARYDPGSQADAELILSPASYQLLGERPVLVHPVRGEGPAGTVIASTAQLREGVVSHLPRYRSSSQGGASTGGAPACQARAGSGPPGRARRRRGPGPRTPARPPTGRPGRSALRRRR